MTRILTWLLSAALLGTIVVLILVVASPKRSEGLTEFFLLGAEGRAVDYPVELRPGQTGMVMVTIVNREGEDIAYTLQIISGGTTPKSIGPLLLGSGERWQQEVDFTVEEAGLREEVSFVLYRDQQSSPYRVLFLILKVTGAESPLGLP